MSFKTSKETSFNKLVVATILMIPFLQIGYDYYLSVAFILFLILSIISIDTIYKDNKCFDFILIGSLFFLVKFFVLVFISVDSREIFIPLRECSCFIGLILISSKVATIQFNYRNIRKYIFYLLSIILLLTVIQIYFIRKGQYFGLPINLFVINKATLQSSELALYHQTRWRPTSFYGEPSYTSWVVLSLLVIVSLIKEFSIKTKVYAFIISLVIVLFSLSLGGIFAVIIYSLFFILSSFEFRKYKKYTLLFLLSLLPIFCLIINFSKELEFRLSEIFSNKDESSNIRFVEPLKYLEDIYHSGEVLGVSKFGELEIDNAGLALIIHYGILVIPMFAIIFKFLQKSPLILYFLLALNFNGTIFRFDKIILLSIVIGITNSNLSNKNRLKSKVQRF